VLARVLPLVGRRLDHGVRALRHDNGWVHQFGDYVIVEPQPRLHAPELGEARNREYFNLLYVPKAGDVVFDVGAGLGWEALFYSRKVGPSGRVIAIEAHPTIADYLKRSMELSRAGNTDVLHLAVADEAGTLMIEDDLSQHLGNSIGRDARGGVPVPAQTLDQICRERGIERVDFLKMNIEGAERPALQGMRGMIDRVAVACISCHDFVFDRTGTDFFRTKAFVEGYFREHGFELVPRTSKIPELRDQVHAYNPRLIGPDDLEAAGLRASAQAAGSA
jgi:FkbM family methyltransferase